MADVSGVAAAVVIAAALFGAEGRVTTLFWGLVTLPLWIHDPIATRAALQKAPGWDSLPSDLGPAPGWLDPHIADEFAKYAAYLAWKFGDLVDNWMPINEPMVHYGPFVMNTRDQLVQAVGDYQSGKLGVIPPGAIMPHVYGGDRKPSTD